MHSAPSVSYPVGRCRFSGGVVLAVWLAGGLTTAVWMLQTESSGARQAAAAVAVLLSGLTALLGWMRSPIGDLIWNEGWTWRAGDVEVSGQVRVILDLQDQVLVRWTADSGSSRWMWLERQKDPIRWGALRRALYSRAKIEASPGLLPTAPRS